MLAAVAFALAKQPYALLFQNIAPSCQSYQTRPAVLRMALSDQEQRISQAMELQPVEKKFPESARSTGLALALDDGTRKSHSVAENTAFVTGFFRGIATKSSFAQLVCALYYVYAAMEAAFEASTDPSVQALDYPELRRIDALEQDMEYYFGSTWRHNIVPSAATRKYVERVQHVAREEPYLLVAHMYTRYLGDLFGGQMMGGMARRSLQLEAGKGTAFYQFDDIPGTKVFIEKWYAELNKLELTDAQKVKIVDEGNVVFALNIEVFEELEGNPIKALW
eukprot:CAMPEP_0119330192 /NCGR_PEP_ID=MMETSP1333-20130426/77702_1 /TAXON_ID=418940 /ORGANISM="Scyphosphaera apsteinii, Strain RCC1455" /LENGTH=278 /DNA_ID=CAMNT_0007339521 /DNA_START=52 /DNA_END=885 /DNA_ORIENTATION=+